MTAALMVVAMAVCFTAGAFVTYINADKEFFGILFRLTLMIVFPFLCGALCVVVLRMFHLIDK